MIVKTTDQVEDNGNDHDELTVTAEQPMGVPPGALETADEDESEDEEEGEEEREESPVR